jgi:PAS domain S-box-containing protein
VRLPKTEKNSLRLYNSRVIQTYLDYIETAFPGLDGRELLDRAGITAHEVSDTGHWFTQQDVDRFHQVVVERTGDENISRKAGRFSASSKGMSLFKQYVIGLLSTETAFLAIGRIHALFSKAAMVEVKRRGWGVMEIIARPGPGVEEKSYQCSNRMGMLEALPRLFTDQDTHIEHPRCFHKGDSACHYIVSWHSPASLKLKRMRNYALLFSAPAAAIVFLKFPQLLMPMLLMLTGLNAVAWIAHGRVKCTELEKIVGTGRRLAEERIERADARYNDSVLVQEVGRATAAILNADALMQQLAALMRSRLRFDRGLILLADEGGDRLHYSAGYGYSANEIAFLRKAVSLPIAQTAVGCFMRAFVKQRALIVNTAADLLGPAYPVDPTDPPVRVGSLLCVPIVYKDVSLGILAVDDIVAKRSLDKSDVNLLEGIAAHIAISINNARSFQKLQQSEAKYRQTMESLREGFFEIDLHRKVLFANLAFSRLLGRSAEDIVHAHFDRFFTAEGQERLEALFANLQQSIEPVHFSPFEIIDRKGKSIPVDLSASVVIDDAGRPVGFRGILRDATERIQLERKRQLLESQIQQIQKLESVGILAGGIAHNFNNWLEGILGNVALIRLRAAQDPKITENALKIESIVEKAAVMNRQLISYARGGNYEVKPTALNKLIREFSETLDTARRDITLTLILDPDLPTVQADRNQIEQVLWNFYINAADAMPGGGSVRIHTARATHAALQGKPYAVVPGEYATVAFSDTGSGIAPEHLNSIFDPFFTTKKGKGTGLGLASAYGIIKSHKGYIEVVSEPGRGTTFQIYLPSTAASESSDGDPDDRQ